MKKNFLKKMSAHAIAMLLCITAAVPAFASTQRLSDNGPGAVQYFDGGQELKMLANQTDSQMMSFILTTSNGAVIVIDGGTPGDADHLREEIAKKGNHVCAWFITHPHSDHGGAFARIVEEGLNGLVIDAVGYNFTEPAWYLANESYRADMVERIRTALMNCGAAPHVMHRNDVFVFDDAVVTCLNDPYLLSGNPINNSSCVLKVQMGGKKIMFLGDLDETAGNMFLADHAGEDLSCDIVQMSHHGQCGVGQNFYQALKPSTCLWCAPAWLYDDPSGIYRSQETRGWMSSLGVTDNQVIKDGDRTLR